MTSSSSRAPSFRNPFSLFWSMSLCDHLSIKSFSLIVFKCTKSVIVSRWSFFVFLSYCTCFKDSEPFLCFPSYLQMEELGLRLGHTECICDAELHQWGFAMFFRQNIVNSAFIQPSEWCCGASLTFLLTPAIRTVKAFQCWHTNCI